MMKSSTTEPIPGLKHRRYSMQKKNKELLEGKEKKKNTKNKDDSVVKNISEQEPEPKKVVGVMRRKKKMKVLVRISRLEKRFK